ncbi:sigma 54 modulation/S30EA ribosomal C-terminal domain-containing protein [Nocardia sp. NBC_01503]|uniref:sigma 54 modulation/S30EA ribosomal C-terminal domain-containing protein n=1 Tax=Nocardia sp. NBC_01503 TaxID=2975997 RepID=UPI002E7C239C|nr:sigma 54 modulation/S30EA ribosomal C-terminal domain-containing protein [Nocardia sp. NBC_01503]WTL30598.1 sigma 54 modulation/S30EA ribosomal C-terminal domain-containing protein [Nocardia sp. NBC_01503]
MRWEELPAADIDRGLTVNTNGPVPAADLACAVLAVSRVLRSRLVDTIGHLRVTRHRREIGMTVFQINASIEGRQCRVQSAGNSSGGARAIAERLDNQIARIAYGATDPWRCSPGRTLAMITEVRPIVRRKLCRMLVLTPMAAAEIMDSMDFDAFFFRDADTGEDAIVYRAGPQDMRLVRQQRVGLPAGPGAARLAVDLMPTVIVPELVAAKRLCGNGLPFVFFTEPETARGRLLYRRYDGNLALLEPVPDTRR